jgi:hypothetical protein
MTRDRRFAPLPGRKLCDWGAPLHLMTRRFWVSTTLALPVFVLAMLADLAPGGLPQGLSMQAVQWIELALATPVVLWGNCPHGSSACAPKARR